MENPYFLSMIDAKYSYWRTKSTRFSYIELRILRGNPLFRCPYELVNPWIGRNSIDSNTQNLKTQKSKEN